MNPTVFAVRTVVCARSVNRLPILTPKLEWGPERPTDASGAQSAGKTREMN